VVFFSVEVLIHPPGNDGVGTARCEPPLSGTKVKIVDQEIERKMAV
jgi:hypothetical protein